MRWGRRLVTKGQGMKNLPFLPTALLLALLTISAGGCASSSNGNSSTPPKFNDSIPDRAQGRNSRGTPQETGQPQDVTNNRR